MSSIKVRQIFDVASSSSHQVYGSNLPVEVQLAGDGRVFYQRFDNSDTTTDPAVIFNKATSPLPSGAKLFAFRSPTQGAIACALSSAASDGWANSIELVPNVWSIIGAHVFQVTQADTAQDIVENDWGVIGYIVYKCLDGNVGDVEILAVY